MRTVVRPAYQPAFQLGFSPAAQMRFNVASQALTTLYNSVQNQLDLLESGDPNLAGWQATLTSLMGEADALIAAAAAADDTSLQHMIDALTGVATRIRAISTRAAEVRRENSPSILAQRGWMLGALALGLGLGAGFLYLSFTKRA